MFDMHWHGAAWINNINLIVIVLLNLLENAKLYQVLQQKHHDLHACNTDLDG